MKFGKRPFVANPKTFKLSKYVDFAALGPPPDAVDHTRELAFRIADNGWGMFDNDRLGCCTVACHTHQVMVKTGLQGKVLRPTDATVEKDYYIIGRTENPGQAKPDNGLAMIDMLSYFRTHSLAAQRIEAFIQIDDVHNHDKVKHAIQMFDGIEMGFGIANATQTFDEFNHRKPWTPQVGKPTEGHVVSGPAYDPALLKFITWGRVQTATWAFWDAQVDEAWVVLLKGQFIPGFDHKTLAADLAALR